MLHKFLWWKLETGCLVLACVSTLYSLLVFIYGLCVYEDFEHMTESWVLRMFADDVSENAIRIAFILTSILDIASSALLVCGIVKKNRHMLMPWITLSVLLFIMALFELDFRTFLIVILIGLCYAIIFGIGYTWYSVLSLYFQYKNEEEATIGVQMAYVQEAPSRLPPYNILTIDK